jgi:hypothetical protein
MTDLFEDVKKLLEEDDPSIQVEESLPPAPDDEHSEPLVPATIN